MYTLDIKNYQTGSLTLTLKLRISSDLEQIINITERNENTGAEKIPGTDMWPTFWLGRSEVSG